MNIERSEQASPPFSGRGLRGRGVFITLEGIDGAGKSTHLAWLVAELQRRGKTVVQTREPGGTSLGEKLRELVLHEPMHLETEALLMFASRREHLSQVIEPALAKGDWVVCDRFTDASYAYQGGGRGLAWDKLQVLECWVHPHLAPDLTLLFEVPLEVAQARMTAAERTADRFEKEKADFHARVRDAYHARASADPGRMRVIDGSQSLEDVKKQLEEILSSVC